MGPKVIKWDGSYVPEELRSLPPGQYAIESEFEDVSADCRGQVIISRVRQNLPIHRRVDIWFKALQEFMTRRCDEKLFDLLETGQIVPWEVRKIE